MVTLSIVGLTERRVFTCPLNWKKKKLRNANEELLKWLHSQTVEAPWASEQARHKTQPFSHLWNLRRNRKNRPIEKDSDGWKNWKITGWYDQQLTFSKWPQERRNLYDSSGGKSLWGVHCTVNELQRHIWSDAKWSDLLGQLHWGMLCYIPDTPLSLTERLAGTSFLGIRLSLKKTTLAKNEGLIEAALVKPSFCWKTIEENEKEQRTEQFREYHRDSSVLRTWF